MLLSDAHTVPYPIVGASERHDRDRAYRVQAAYLTAGLRFSPSLQDNDVGNQRSRRVAAGLPVYTRTHRLVCWCCAAP